MRLAKPLLLGLLLVMAGVLASRLAMGDLLGGGGGVAAYLRLKEDHAALVRDVHALEDTAVDVSREVRLLKQGGEYAEQAIRQRTNFVKDGEVVYYMPSAPEGQDPSRRTP